MKFLSVGIGCDRDVSQETLMTALNLALMQCGCALPQIRHIASIDKKADETAILHLVQGLKVPFVVYPAQELAKVPVRQPSATVLKFMGTPSVSEAAALLTAGFQESSKVPALLVEKLKFCGEDGKNVTISIAEEQTDE